MSTQKNRLTETVLLSTHNIQCLDLININLFGKNIKYSKIISELLRFSLDNGRTDMLGIMHTEITPFWVMQLDKQSLK